MTAPRKLYSFCSLLMASLFAYSASVQLNDSDWYFWIPLYSCACVVNIANWVVFLKPIRSLAEVTLWLGIFLFIKVVIEDVVGGIAGVWSIDLSERVVREKIGSGLVVASMLMQLSVPRGSLDLKNKRKEFPGFSYYGMVMLVILSYGLPFNFFVLQKGEMKF